MNNFLFYKSFYFDDSFFNILERRIRRRWKSSLFIIWLFVYVLAWTHWQAYDLFYPHLQRKHYSYCVLLIFKIQLNAYIIFSFSLCFRRGQGKFLWENDGRLFEGFNDECPPKMDVKILSSEWMKIFSCYFNNFLGNVLYPRIVAFAGMTFGHFLVWRTF